MGEEEEMKFRFLRKKSRGNEGYFEDERISERRRQVLSDAP